MSSQEHPEKINVEESASDEMDALKISAGFLSGRTITHTSSSNKSTSKDKIQSKKEENEETIVKERNNEDIDDEEEEEEDEVYPMMKSRSKGLCLLFEFDTFRSDLGLSSRKGSEVDRESAIQSFKALGFKVKTYQNLKFSELTKTLAQYAESSDLLTYNSFAMVFLSHGNMGTVYAYDSPFPTQRIWEPFTADNCPNLAGKPKMFFLQACQGSNMDNGVWVTETDASSFASYKIPIHADFLIAHSTIGGYYSWRNTIQGSWYIQSLTSILDRYHGKKDLLSILTMTTKKVALEYESSSSRKEFNNMKQTPFFYSTLTKKLFI